MPGRRLAVPLIVIASVAVGGVAGALIGVPALSGASTPTATPVTTQAPNAQKPNAAPAGPEGQFAAAAQALHLTTDQLMQKLSDGKTTIADVAKQQNVSRNDVIDAIAATDRQRIEDFVNRPFPKGGKGAFGGPAASGFGRGFGLEGGLNEVAKALNLTPQQLMQELRGGKSIAQIAKDHNVDVNKAIDAAVAAASARIDKAKDAGAITPAQAEKAKTALRDAITKFVNGERPKFGGFGMRGHGPGFGGPGAGAGAAPGASTP